MAHDELKRVAEVKAAREEWESKTCSTLKQVHELRCNARRIVRNERVTEEERDWLLDLIVKADRMTGWQPAWD